MRRVPVAITAAILLALLLSSVATAKGPPVALKAVIFGGSLAAPVEVVSSEMEAFQAALSESWRLTGEPPVSVPEKPVAVLHLWLGGDLSREKADFIVEYHRIGDIGFLYYRPQQTEFVMGNNFWTDASPTMEEFLLRYLGTPPLSSSWNSAPASTFPWLWVSASSAAALVAISLLSLILVKQRKTSFGRRQTSH